MKKILAILICVCILMCSLAACGGSATAEDETIDRRFVIVEKCDMGTASMSYVIADTDTGVLYHFIKSGYGGGLTVMVDSDGKPLIWEVGT